MRGVVRFALVVASFSALGAVGCAAGDDDPVEPTQTVIAKAETPRKVFRGSTANPPRFVATDGADQVTADGSELFPSPSPIDQPFPTPPMPAAANETH